MKIQYDAHGRKKRVNVAVMNSAKKSLSLSNEERKLTGKVIRMYFDIARETVLAGYDWRFPNGMLLGIREQRKPGVYGVSRYKRGEDGYRVRVKNVRRINRHYTIDLSGTVLNMRGYRFESNADFRKKLTHILFNTDAVFTPKVK